MSDNVEELLQRAKVESQMEEHYEKVFDGMVRWCIFGQEETLDTVMKAFGVDAQAVTLKAMEKVLNKYKGELDVPKSGEDVPT